MNDDIFLSRRRAISTMAAAGLATAIPFLPAFAHAPAGHHASARDLGTGAAFDPQGRLWVAIKESSPEGQYVTIRNSDDMGKTWTPARRVMKKPEPVTASGEARPHIAFGPEGEMYISFTSTIARPHIGDIRFLRSLDGGKTFSEPVTVQTNTDAVTHSFESMVVDKTGRIYIVWVDGRDAGFAKAQGKPYAGSAVYFAVSDNRGTSFSRDVKVADHSCECCRIGLALHPENGPIALWRHVFEPNIRDHALARLTPDGRAEPLQRATFDDWRIDACPHHGPSLAFSADGRRHQVWFDGSPSGGARYAWTNALGELSRPMALGSAQATHPDVAAHGSLVAMAWKEFDGRITTVVARWSENNGQTWRQTTLAATDAESDKPYLLGSKDGIVLLWRTQAEGIRAIPVRESRQ